MNYSKASKLLCMAVLVLATSAANCLYAEDTKRIGLRYRLKVTSAGIPTLGAVMNGYKVRSRYQVLSKGERVGEAYLGDPVYVAAPGKYTIVVNGRQRTMNFVIPREMTRDRILACWARQRAVELRPSKLGKRFTVPSIFVIHPTSITGKHNDNYEIYGIKNGKVNAKRMLAKGVAVVYAPEEIKDIDDGVLFANTLVHLMPGEYQLRINGTRLNFELAAGESQLLRLAGLAVKGKWPAELSVVQRRASGRKGKIVQPSSDRFFVVAPGKYEIGQQGVVVNEGKAVTFQYDSKKLPGLRKPRLGVRAINDERGGIRVTGFVLNSPAAKAGLKVGDLILSIDNQKTKTTRDLGMALKKRKFGDKATFEIQRAGRKQPLKVEVLLGVDRVDRVERKGPIDPVQNTPVTKPKAARKAYFVKGFGFACALNDKNQLSVTAVQEGGAASQYGVKTGDLIKGVDTAEYNPASELLDLLKSHGKKPLSLLLKRAAKDENAEAKLWTVTLKMKQPRKAVRFKKLGLTCDFSQKNALRILRVREGSPAAQQEIRAGDLITGVEYVQEASADKLVKTLRNQMLEFRQVTINVMRVEKKANGGTATMSRYITLTFSAKSPAKKAKSKPKSKAPKEKRKLF